MRHARVADRSRDPGWPARTGPGPAPAASVSVVDVAPAPVLEVIGARVEFGDRTVLADLDLTIHAGEVVALLGDAGSGRSTLCRTLNRTEALTAGEVRLDGAPLPHQRTALAVLRADVALVPPHAYLASGRTVLEECAAGPARVRELGGDAATARARDALAAVGLDEHGERPTGTLDPEARQRAALARALALDPRVLLLDDPTGELGPRDAARFHGHVTPVLVDPARTVVLVEPDLDRVREVADRVVVLEAGRVVEDAPTARFFAGPASDAGRRCLAGGS